MKMKYEIPFAEILKFNACPITDSNGLNDRGDNGNEESGGWDDLV